MSLKNQMNKIRNILTNPDDMSDFLKMVKNGLNQTRKQEEELKNQLEQVQQIINTHENQIALLEDWQTIMAGDDLTIIKMAYEDIKKNMKDIKNA